MTLFSKILIANRGEIACRIIRTAQKFNIKTVAVFSKVDSNALHAQLADEAYLIGPAASKDSYLSIEKIMAIAKQTGATGIHPGYGFLSENATFAKACEQENITFIGPSSSIIHLMGNKNIAKEIMQQHGVPILTGHYDQNQSKENLFNAAKNIGFPIVLKAVSGGGGKGLRLVHNESEFEHAFLAVRREANAFFKDDKILLEKYLTNARHIEVQILADHFGNVQALFTRDCSIQRRHQKIVEEAPAPINPELTDKILAAAVKATKAIHYTNAGTIEFLVAENNFYFMEMNTRLQVEHPVTEMITGLDLVEWQFRIAAGEQLFKNQVVIRGHAIEARLNAEDPEKDFLPSCGKLHYYYFPANQQEIRIDTGYQTGDMVGIYYDSLLAKLIVWGENRALAILRLQQLLERTAIFGIKTNLHLLKEIIQNENFLQSNITTHFLQQHTFDIKKTPNNEIFCACALFLLQLNKLKVNTLQLNDPFSPWLIHDGWQLYFVPFFELNFISENEKICVQIKSENQVYIVTIGNKEFKCTVQSITLLKDNIYRFMLIIGNEYFETIIFNNSPKIEVITKHEYYMLEKSEKFMDTTYNDHDEQLLAPMPGTLVALHVNSGQKVTKGEKLLVIEAMKMEHTFYAPKDGIVKECHYQIGDLIKEGSELLEFEAD